MTFGPQASPSAAVISLVLIPLCGSFAQNTYSLGSMLGVLNTSAHSVVASNANFKGNLVSFSNTTVRQSIDLGGRLMKNATEVVSSTVSFAGNASHEIINHGRNVVSGALGVLSALPFAGQYLPTSIANSTANIGFNVAAQATQLGSSAAQTAATAVAQTGSTITGALSSASISAHDLVASGQVRTSEFATRAVSATVNKTSLALGAIGRFISRIGNAIATGSVIPTTSPIS